MPAAAALAGLPISEGMSGITGDSCPSPAATLMNLLPLAGANPRPPIGGAYIGEGMPPIPARLATKIRQWEFVEMGELLPEFWARQKDDEEGRDRGARQSRKVTEVLTWVQCYSSFVAVLAPSEPQAVPELMAYLNLIVRASQDYEGLGCVRYDSAFRRQAALTGNKKWSAINSTLYAMNFSARKVGTRRCELCFTTSHAEQDCAQRGSADPGVSDRLRYLESAVIAMVRLGAGKPTGGDVPAPGRWGRSVPEVEHGDLQLPTMQVPACMLRLRREPPFDTLREPPATRETGAVPLLRQGQRLQTNSGHCHCS